MEGKITSVWISKEPFFTGKTFEEALNEGKFYKLPVDGKGKDKVRALTATIPRNGEGLPFIEMLLKKLNEDLKTAMSNGEEYVERENQEAADEEWAKADYIQGLIDSIKTAWNIP